MRVWWGGVRPERFEAQGRRRRVRVRLRLRLTRWRGRGREQGRGRCAVLLLSMNRVSLQLVGLSASTKGGGGQTFSTDLASLLTALAHSLWVAWDSAPLCFR